MNPETASAIDVMITCKECDEVMLPTTGRVPMFVRGCGESVCAYCSSMHVESCQKCKGIAIPSVNQGLIRFIVKVRNLQLPSESERKPRESGRRLSERKGDNGRSGVTKMSIVNVEDSDEDDDSYNEEEEEEGEEEEDSAEDSDEGVISDYESIASESETEARVQKVPIKAPVTNLGKRKATEDIPSPPPKKHKGSDASQEKIYHPSITTVITKRPPPPVFAASAPPVFAAPAPSASPSKKKPKKPTTASESHSVTFIKSADIDGKKYGAIKAPTSKSGSEHDVKFISDTPPETAKKSKSKPKVDQRTAKKVNEKEAPTKPATHEKEKKSDTQSTKKETALMEKIVKTTEKEPVKIRGTIPPPQEKRGAEKKEAPTTATIKKEEPKNEKEDKGKGEAERRKGTREPKEPEPEKSKPQREDRKPKERETIEIKSDEEAEREAEGAEEGRAGKGEEMEEDEEEGKNEEEEDEDEDEDEEENKTPIEVPSACRFERKSISEAKKISFTLPRPADSCSALIQNIFSVEPSLRNENGKSKVSLVLPPLNKLTGAIIQDNMAIFKLVIYPMNKGTLKQEDPISFTLAYTVSDKKLLDAVPALPKVTNHAERIQAVMDMAATLNADRFARSSK